MKVSKTAHIILGAPDENASFPDPLRGDIVIGVDGGAIKCLEKNIGLTMAVGDFDSISMEEKEKLEATGALLHEYEADKDDTDAEIALALAMEDETVHNIRIYNWTGGRLDHLMSILFMVYQPRFQEKMEHVTLVNQINTISFYSPGKYTLEKEEAKKYLSFIGLTPIDQLTLKQVKYPLNRKSYSYPVALISNEFLEQECYFSFEKGVVAVIQSTDK